MMSLEKMPALFVGYDKDKDWFSVLDIKAGRRGSGIGDISLSLTVRDGWRSSGLTMYKHRVPVCLV